MKLLFINTLYSPHIGGGAEITLKSLVDGIFAKGYEVSVLTTGPESGITEDEVDGIRVYRAGVSNLYWQHRKDKAPGWQRGLWHLRDSYNPAMGKIVESVVRDIKPDLVNCHNLAGFSASTWPAIKQAGAPIVQVLHDLYNICPNSNMFCKGSSCTTQCMRCKLFRLPHVALSENVDCVIGVSRFVLQRHLEHGLFSQAKIKTAIHNTRAMALSHHEGPVETSGKITFGFIGTLVPAKGVELLIKAFSAVNLDKQAKLLIAGTGPESYLTELKRYASDCIEFLGYTSQEDFFPKIDILVVPSIWNDTLPGVVFESLTYGVPVIGSQRGGIPEMITDGVNGFLFEPDVHEELPSIMEKIINNPGLIRGLKDEVLRSAMKFIDVDLWIDKYISTYSQVLENKCNEKHY